MRESLILDCDRINYAIVENQQEHSYSTHTARTFQHISGAGHHNEHARVLKAEQHVMPVIKNNIIPHWRAQVWVLPTFCDQVQVLQPFKIRRTWVRVKEATKVVMGGKTTKMFKGLKLWKVQKGRP